MVAGLSPQDIVNVQIVLQPLPALLRSFGNLLIAGNSKVIDPVERIRLYTTLTGVANDFGTTAPEYLAAAIAFSQVPQLSQLYIGRALIGSGSSATLHGATLTPTQQVMSNFTGITTGSTEITVDGTLKILSGLNFSAAANLNTVAADVTTALGGSATVVWNSVYGRFEVTSASSGASSSLTYAAPTGSGVDVSALLGLTAAAGSGVPVNGLLGETVAIATQNLIAASSAWYGMVVVTPTAQTPADSALLAAAAVIEGANPTRVFGITCMETNIIDPTQTNDLASVLQSFGYNRTFLQYSSQSPYAVCSAFARAFTVDFTGSDTTLTLKFQTEPGVQPEVINEVQAAAATSKNANIYVSYTDGVSILQQGVMSSGRFFDEIFATDALQNSVQTAVLNVLLTAGTKVPQTDEGVHLLVTAIEQVMVQFVNNGFLAPGVWTASGFGQIVNGQTLSKGFYVYAPPVATQNLSDRAARKAPLIQVAAKEAGAIHFSNIQINVAR